MLLGRIPSLIALLVLLSCAIPVARAIDTYRPVIDQVQPKIVKIYGAGGLQRLEDYQSGFLISPEGHILTAWSYVLDSDVITIHLDDGQRLEAQLVGYDPRVEIAVLKIEGAGLPHFSLTDAVELEAGDRVLAFTNLYNVAVGNEPASVLHGRVSVRTTLDGRRGAFETPYKGEVYILDAMTNNPGAAGGAVTDKEGRLAGIVGKELRSSLSNIWLNYAIPVHELQSHVDDIIAGRIGGLRDDPPARTPLDPLTLGALGITLVPDVLPKTPPFIDKVRPDSPADDAGLKPDDLVLFVNNHIVSSCEMFREELSYIDRLDEIRLTVQRGQELIEVTLGAER